MGSDWYTEGTDKYATTMTKYRTITNADGYVYKVPVFDEDGTDGGYDWTLKDTSFIDALGDVKVAVKDAMAESSTGETKDGRPCPCGCGMKFFDDPESESESESESEEESMPESDCDNCKTLDAEAEALAAELERITDQRNELRESIEWYSAEIVKAWERVEELEGGATNDNESA